MGEEPAPDAGHVSRGAGVACAADRGGPDAERLPALRAAEGAAGPDRLRGSARARDPALRRGRRGRADLPPALPGVHGGRVPGREPAPADAARALAGRPGRAVRRRRRLPVDLLVHGRDAGVPAAGAGPGVPAGGELPLDAGDPRAREPAGAEARRRGEGAAGDAAGGRSAGAAGVRGRGGGGRVDRRQHQDVPPGGRAVRGDGGAVPDQLALGGLRGGALGGGDPVPGARRRVPGEAGGARDAAGAARVGRPAGRNRRGGRASAGPGGGRAGRRRRGGADAPGRPRALRPSGGGVRRGHGGGVPGRSPEPLRRGGVGPRRQPADVPPSEGPGVRGRLPPAAGGGRAAVQARRSSARRWRRSAACSTSG